MAVYGAVMIAPNSPTTNWCAVMASGSVFTDVNNDHTRKPREGEILGDAGHPTFYTQFDNSNTASPTDGDLAFRIRLAEDSTTSGYSPDFELNFFVGIDANGDGSIDLFVGVNNVGGANQIAIWNPGAGANDSPATTSVNPTPLVTYAETTANYDFSQVNTTIGRRSR